MNMRRFIFLLIVCEFFSLACIAANIVISLFITKYRVKYLNIFSYCNRKIGIKNPHSPESHADSDI